MNIFGKCQPPWYADDADIKTFNHPDTEAMLTLRHSIILTPRPCWPPGTSSSPTLPSPTSSSAPSPCRHASLTSSPITGLLEQTLWVSEIPEHYLSRVQKTLQWCQFYGRLSKFDVLLMLILSWSLVWDFHLSHRISYNWKVWVAGNSFASLLQSS